MRYLIAVLVVSLSACGPDLELEIGGGEAPCTGRLVSCTFGDAGEVVCVDAGYRTYPRSDGGTCPLER